MSCIFNVILRVTAKKAIQRDILKNPIDKRKLNSRKCTNRKAKKRKQRNNTKTKNLREQTANKNKMTVLSANTIISLNVSGLNTPIKG